MNNSGWIDTEPMSALRAQIILLVSKEPRTIQSLCKELNIDNEYKVMRVLADMEDDTPGFGLMGFDRGYESDGGAFYLAKYGFKEEKA